MVDDWLLCPLTPDQASDTLAWIHRSDIADRPRGPEGGRVALCTGRRQLPSGAARGGSGGPCPDWRPFWSSDVAGVKTGHAQQAPTARARLSWRRCCRSGELWHYAPQLCQRCQERLGPGPALYQVQGRPPPRAGEVAGH